MRYDEAIEVACERLIEAGKNQPIYQATVVLIAGIIGDMYDKPTRAVLSDVKRMRQALIQEETEKALKPSKNRLIRDFREWEE